MNFDKQSSISTLTSIHLTCRNIESITTPDLVSVFTTPDYYSLISANLDPISLIFLRRTCHKLWIYLRDRMSIVNNVDPLYSLFTLFTLHSVEYCNWNCIRILSRSNFIDRCILSRRFDYLCYMNITFEYDDCIGVLNRTKDIKMLMCLPESLLGMRVKCIVELKNIYKSPFSTGQLLDLSILSSVKSKQRRITLTGIVDSYNRLHSSENEVLMKTRKPNPIVRMIKRVKPIGLIA